MARTGSGEVGFGLLLGTILLPLLLLPSSGANQQARGQTAKPGDQQLPVRSK